VTARQTQSGDGRILSGGDVRVPVPPSIRTMRIRGDARGLWRVELLGVATPGLLFSVAFGLPVLFVSPEIADFWLLPRFFRNLVMPRGAGRVQQTRRDFVCVQQSTPHRLCENRAVIDWVRLLGGCVGRAGRHRPRRRNHSLRSLIPPYTQGRLPLQTSGENSQRSV
jgi:hypothetical protein